MQQNYLIQESKHTHIYVTRFAIRDYFWQDICDQICEKEPLLKHLKNSFVYIQLLYMHSNFMYTKLFLRCFNSGLFSQIRSRCFEGSGPLL